MKSTTFALSLLACAASAFAQSTTKKPLGVPVPSQLPKPGERRSQGCWKEQGDWELQDTLEWPSTGSCGIHCLDKKKLVAAVHAEECYCGDTYPPDGTQVEDKYCKYPCPAFDEEACGGIEDGGYYSVFNTGVKAQVPFAEGDEDDDDKESSSTTSVSPTGASQTKGPSDTPSSDKEESGGTNTVGVAVGVVVGVIVLGLASGALYFYIRRRRLIKEDEEKTRNDAVNAFVGRSGKAGSMSGSFSDSRLDPVMANRRMSDGSIADNHDYSRKILRVTNA